MLPKDANRKKVKYRNKLPKTNFELYRSWCIRCGLCAKVCPQCVLFMGDDGYPELLKPEECTICFCAPRYVLALQLPSSMKIIDPCIRLGNF